MAKPVTRDEFLRAHLSTKTAASPSMAAPQSRDAAYEIQDLIVGAPDDIAGWKVGCGSTNPEPYCAPIPKQRQLLPTACYNWPAHQSSAKIEAEIGFVVGQDVAANSGPYSRQDCCDLIRDLVPAIEILESRLAGPAADNALWKLADLQGNGGIILGQPTPWTDQNLNLAMLALTSLDTPRAVHEAVPHPFGDPVGLLHWLVNHTASQRGGLIAGQVIITGSYCGILNIATPGLCEFEFTGVGTVQMNIWN